MTLTEEFAALLDAHDLGTWDPTGTSGDIFAAALPPDPDSALAVTLYTSTPSDSQLGYDEPVFLVRTRGPRGRPTVAEARAQAVYDALHGLPRTTLPGGGTVALSCHGTTAGPVYAGADDQGRHEYTISFAVELRRATANRV